MVLVSRDPVTAYVAIGANLGDALQTVRWALGALDRLPGTRVTGQSRLYRTAPHEARGPDFVDAVAQIDTRLTAPDLLDALQARTLDLDVLFYGQAHVHSPRLTVPHPRWRERAFVLYPLADLAPNLVSAEHWARVSGQVIDVLPEDQP